MAENRRGLGRGLSALLGEAEEIRHAVDPAEGVREIPIELIRRNPHQPRTEFEEADIVELAESIREKGVLQPILVRPLPESAGEFQIVAGERRWRAAQKAGLMAMPALVRPLGDDEAFEIAVIENIQRADLNPVEEARAYASLVERLKVGQDEVARRVGKSRSHVANTMRLTALPDVVQVHLMVGRLTAGHARALLTSDDAEALAEQVIARGLSVRETEALARAKSAAPRKASGPRKAKDADTAALEVDLEEALGMNVDIADRGGVGEVKIKYASLEQLDELCRRLTRA
ncbi:MAG: ParB/RepB/Spo0J family partition protein [Phenylobacterium sp.]|uniref:ParB/RepB/Spo0J family partition protein n=1 Tax=Phenylobacterium sp. TaxID=1871053 RepID=UPI001A4C451E|nr:ParB/RepB/Spo0J family partition protein [Phenylobacterium sp.]MBL8554240.1 ParB/RepB/Spo0J family partition protein [Phenylobacterium sp.]